MTSKTLEAAGFNPNTSHHERVAETGAIYSDLRWSTPFNPKVERGSLDRISGFLELYFPSASTRTNNRAIARALHTLRRLGLSPADLMAHTNDELLSLEHVGLFTVDVASALVFYMTELLDDQAIYRETGEPLSALEMYQDLNVRLSELIKLARFVFDLAVSSDGSKYLPLLDALKNMTDTFTQMVLAQSHNIQTIQSMEHDLWKLMQEVFSVRDKSQLQARFLPHESSILRSTQRVELGEYVWHGVWPEMTVADAIRLICADSDEYGMPFGLMKALSPDGIANTRAVLQTLTPQFEQAEFGSKILLFGNVARGIGDASFLQHLITESHPHTHVEWDMYRFSPIKEHDPAPLFLERKQASDSHPSDVIMVDSFSGGGNSVINTVAELKKEFPEATIWVFITQGYDWSGSGAFEKIAGVDSLYDREHNVEDMKDAVLYKLVDIKRLPNPRFF